MSIQHQRVVELCNELRLGGVAAQYTALAQQAAEKQTSFTDFVEELLSAERESRRARAREMFARIAGFPAIKTLRQLGQRLRRRRGTHYSDARSDPPSLDNRQHQWRKLQTQG